MSALLVACAVDFGPGRYGVDVGVSYVGGFYEAPVLAGRGAGAIQTARRWGKRRSYSFFTTS
jgi:hypothetical protein